MNEDNYLVFEGSAEDLEDFLNRTPEPFEILKYAAAASTVYDRTYKPVTDIVNHTVIIKLGDSHAKPRDQQVGVPG